MTIARERMGQGVLAALFTLGALGSAIAGAESNPIFYVTAGLCVLGAGSCGARALVP